MTKQKQDKDTIKTIWKVPLIPSLMNNQIKLPKGSVPLSVALQYGDIEGSPQLWFITNPNEKRKETFCISNIGTGHTSETRLVNPKNFLGTLIMEQGHSVQHAFWKKGLCEKTSKRLL